MEIEQNVLILAAIALGAAVVNGALGYGFSSITVPIALLLFSSRVLNPALVLVEVPLNLYVLAVNRKSVPAVFRRVSPILVGLVPGVIAGSFLLASLNPGYVKLITYAVLLPLIMVQIAGLRWPIQGVERKIGLPFGAGLGVLYSVTTISGPPLALLFNNQGYEKGEFRAALGIVRTAESSLTAVVYAFLHLYTPESLTLLPFTFLSILVGVPIGGWLIGRISVETFRRVCMSFDAWIVGFGLSRVLPEVRLAELPQAYLVLLPIVVIDAVLLYRYFSKRGMPPAAMNPSKEAPEINRAGGDARMSAMTWKEKLADKIPPDLGREIDEFEAEIELRKQGKLDEKIFMERRLRRGVYGQRYDAGTRHDGKTTQSLAYPNPAMTKGPGILWDAPGMQRIKIPYGGLTPVQLEALGELAEEYSDGILHVTTRQDIQLHNVHVEETPAIFRRLAAVGITTREACGNTVRNVTGCPIAGVCRDETFDITPYARAASRFLLGHRDTQDFGRKFKVAFSGCAGNGCGLAMMHDVGAIAKVKDGKRGFEFFVGGGLGAVPYQAKLFDSFLPEEELLPTAQAISRVFARLGEKKNRNRARLKFLVEKLGLEEFKRLVLEERKSLPADPAWTSFLSDLHSKDESPAKGPAPLNGHARPAGFEEWAKSNVYRQRQPGYAVATVTFPLGDFTANQARALADVARKYIGEAVRLTVEQNAVLRWVREADLPALYADLKAAGLGEPGAGTIVDITACPGTDTCKLGIASSRGLAGELRTRLAARSASMEEAIRGLKIKISGCFNSCGQHHVSDIGFYGVSRKKGNYAVPHFQVLVGGQWVENAGAYGLAVIAIPSKRIPEVVDRLGAAYVRERQGSESFPAWVKRAGKGRIRQLIEDLAEVPSHEKDASFYSDWRDPREFTIGDMGLGECAGEVVSPVDFGLSDAERRAFEAQLALDGGDLRKASDVAVGAMLKAAQELVRTQLPDVGETPAEIVKEFRDRLVEPKLFWDPFAGGRFGQFLFKAVETPPDAKAPDAVHRLVEEAQLFIEAAHACRAKMAQSGMKV